MLRLNFEARLNRAVMLDDESNKMANSHEIAFDIAARTSVESSISFLAHGQLFELVAC
jgi:hypothetical protein